MPSIDADRVEARVNTEIEDAAKLAGRVFLKRLAMAGPVVPNEKPCQSPTISCLLETGLDDFE